MAEFEYHFPVQGCLQGYSPGMVISTKYSIIIITQNKKKNHTDNSVNEKVFEVLYPKLEAQAKDYG